MHQAAPKIMPLHQVVGHLDATVAVLPACNAGRCCRCIVKSAYAVRLHGLLIWQGTSGSSIDPAVTRSYSVVIRLAFAGETGSMGCSRYRLVALRPLQMGRRELTTICDMVVVDSQVEPVTTNSLVKWYVLALCTGTSVSVEGRDLTCWLGGIACHIAVDQFQYKEDIKWVEQIVRMTTRQSLPFYGPL